MLAGIEPHTFNIRSRPSGAEPKRGPFGGEIAPHIAWVEALIFCGIQATGKSRFYKERFADTHIRINLDMLRTRHREAILVAACLAAQQPFVVESTNLTVQARARHMAPARAAGFRVIGYHFESDLKSALARNAARPEPARVPAAAIAAASRQLERPTLAEGFEVLYTVRIVDGGFAVEPLT
jgi:predicted kinase